MIPSLSSSIFFNPWLSDLSVANASGLFGLPLMTLSALG
jgi:hypothetical protein